MQTLTMGDLIARYGAEWATAPVPAPGGRWLVRAVLRADESVILTAGSAAEMADAIEARKAGA